jgi:hypothetical protein
MKKHVCFAGIALALVFAAALTACSTGDDAPPVFDNPRAGIMSEATALNIFNYSVTPEGGIRIDKFKSAAALRGYLAAAPAASVNFRAAGSTVTANTLFLCKIGGRNVVAIGSAAFTPTPGIPDTDITTAVAIIKLPPTITAIAKNSFEGLATYPQLAIPPEVYDLLPGDVKTALGNNTIVGLLEVSAYSVPVSVAYGKFLGTLTLDDLHEALGMPRYAVGKSWGLSAFLDEGLTQEVNGSTRLTKNTLLYFGAEDMMPEVTSYPGLDTSDWPQDSASNGVDGAFKVSQNGKAMAYNPFGRGDGKGTRIPDIWFLEESGAGSSPAGTWIHMLGGTSDEEKIIFTGTTLTTDSPYFDTRRYDYTVSGNKFICNNGTIIPYIPTAAESAEIAAFNEAAYRAAHPWVPAASTITPTATKQGVQYRIEDHPDMTFVNDPAVIGRWTTIDMVIKPEWFDPADLLNDDYMWLNSLEFIAGGGLKMNGYTDPNDKWKKNLLYLVDGDGPTAPKYEIRTIGGVQYLFVENKSGDYSRYSQKPQWFVLKK